MREKERIEFFGRDTEMRVILKEEIVQNYGKSVWKRATP